MLLLVFIATSDPIHKATIIPRGRALGMVMRLPQEMIGSLWRLWKKLKADIAVAMAGKVLKKIPVARKRLLQVHDLI